MKVEVDLHLHTSASDGRLSPKELVTFIADKELSVISITDHDTTSSFDEALGAADQFSGLEIIPGIELSSVLYEEEVHILGYYLNPLDDNLQSTLKGFRKDREYTIKQMVEKLSESRVYLDWERVLEIAGDGAIGRPHIAYAMLEKGYIKDFAEAFDKYIGRLGIGYVERKKITSDQACRLITDAGGVPVLAHPKYLKSPGEIVEFLIPYGLSGVEVYYARHSSHDIEFFHAIAQQYALLPCGGSDYHGTGTLGEKIPGEMGPPLWVTRELSRISQKFR